MVSMYPYFYGIWTNHFGIMYADSGHIKRHIVSIAIDEDGRIPVVQSGSRRMLRRYSPDLAGCYVGTVRISQNTSGVSCYVGTVRISQNTSGVSCYVATVRLPTLPIYRTCIHITKLVVCECRLLVGSLAIFLYCLYVWNLCWTWDHKHDREQHFCFLSGFSTLLQSIGRDSELHTSIHDKRDAFRTWVAMFQLRLPMAFLSRSLYDMPGLAPHMDVLFWEQREFQISFSNRDTSRNDWNRHSGSFMFDTGVWSNNNMKFPSHKC